MLDGSGDLALGGGIREAVPRRAKSWLMHGMQGEGRIDKKNVASHSNPPNSPSPEPRALSLANCNQFDP